MEREMIAVDEWNCRSEAYFLTHLHADHTRGLSSRWCRGPLYCSRITALLLPIKFQGFEESLIRVLEVGFPSVIPVTSRKTAAQSLVEVTPIDARHCPGAVMYLFRGEFGCELYTGDFRWEVEGSGGAKEQLLTALGGAKVDHLHLDNTFCNPRFNFPPRFLAAQQVADIILHYRKHDVVIGVDTLGKEELLLHIANILKTKIWVWPERLQIMHLLELPDVFTTDASITRVRAVPRYSLTAETVKVLNSIRPTIGILPTGSSCLFKIPSMESCFVENFQLNTASAQSKECLDGCLGEHLDSTTMRQSEACNLNSLKSCVKLVHGNMYLVLYSLHCCFSEIQSFIELLKPSCLTGNLPVCEINPNYYFSHLCKGKHSCMMVETYDNIERDIMGKVRAFSPECNTLVSGSCKPQKNSINGRKMCRKSLRRLKKIYANKVNRSRRKGCGTKIYHWDSDKDVVEEFPFKVN